MESTQTQSIAKCSLKSRQIFWLWKTENSGRRPHKLLQRVQQTQHVVFGNVFPLIGFMSDDRDLKRVDRIENVVRQIALKDCFDAAQTFAFIAVILDCVDAPSKEFYQHFDFAQLPGYPMRLYLPFKLLEKLAQD